MNVISRVGAHEPLTDAATWEVAQRPRYLNIKHLKYERALLSGLARAPHAGTR